ncbi:hypothetical protein SCHPADRAFT_941253 [Schizopora paradoxa]|uniref:DUF6533 domain-containing protein n=1 Tax=Schizopora paradoxa TaxID=27342 RepID=A0A0H2S6J6_9AGAM|nr:hypothetical protein SCHPADRAFT_941253 [Schizopora paradoxa]
MSIEDTRDNQNYIVASAVIFYYDFILTSAQEHKHVWSRPIGMINVLVISLRYTAVVSYAMVLALTFFPEIIEDWFLYKIPGIFGLSSQFFVLVFMIIRLFAIYDEQCWVLCVTLPAAFVNIALSGLVLANVTFVSLVTEIPIIAEDAGGFVIHSSSCFISPDPEREIVLIFKLSYISALLIDTVICILSVWKIGRIFFSRRCMYTISSLTSILLRDGCVLYIALLISNVFSFVAYTQQLETMISTSVFLPANFPETASETALRTREEPLKYLFVISSGTNSELTHALSVVLISRMIFNLREVGTEIYESTRKWRSRIEHSTDTMELGGPNDSEFLIINREESETVEDIINAEAESQ